MILVRSDWLQLLGDQQRAELSVFVLKMTIRVDKTVALTDAVAAVSWQPLNYARAPSLPMLLLGFFYMHEA